MPTIEFLIQRRKVNVGMYSNLKKAGVRHGIDMGNGVVEIVEGVGGLSPKSFLEKKLLGNRPDHIRIASLAEVIGDVCVITDYKPKPSRQ